MPLWRCPHCGVPQAESARCWVCKRSTTACGTCRHFRRGVAGGLGFCGLDPRRGPLQGHELRPCWTARETAPGSGRSAAHEPAAVPAGFVPITAGPAEVEVIVAPPTGGSLWGHLGGDGESTEDRLGT